MYERFLTSRRRFLQGVVGLLGLATTGLLGRAFAGTRPQPPGVGTHLVVMTVADKDHVWHAQAHVGDDPTVAAKVVRFANAEGKPHRGLEAWFYADCVEAGATRLDNAYDYINCRSVTVTYDGQDVPVPKSSKKDGTFDFWRGCRCPAIRYGKQVGWNKDKIDWSLLPSYARVPQKPWDDSRMDYSFNGMGNATTRTMGQGGARPDLGYMSVWNMAFLTDPSDATWEVVRRIEDHIGWWGMVYTSDPEAGHIVDMYKYPGTSTLPQSQVHAWKNNALVSYGGSYDGDTLIVGKGGPRSGHTTASPFIPNGAHLTSYALLAAMITGTARDRDHASFWANWTILEISVPFTMKRGCAIGAQRRFAWCLRDLFMASYVSSDCAYFAKETARNLSLAMAHATNPVGLYDVKLSYPRKSPKDGGAVAAAPWMQYYLATTIDAVSHKLPEWKPFAQFLGKFMANWGKYPFTMLASIGSFNALDPKTRQTMDDFPAQAALSLPRFHLTAEQAQAVVSGATVQDVYNAYKAAVPTWGGKCVNGVADLIGYLGSPDAYGAMAVAATVAAVNAGVEGADKTLAYMNAMPTKIDYSRDGKFNLVPRA
ncbi:MAG TPA: hypothetical protein VFW60_00365 [Rhodanobacteraceae bacterium]|nr:hypothetical protein [Rhodanobacteraceae bacterium]